MREGSPRPTCHLAYATCHVIHVTCHNFYLLVLKWRSFSVEGLLWTAPTISSFYPIFAHFQGFLKERIFFFFLITCNIFVSLIGISGINLIIKVFKPTIQSAWTQSLETAIFACYNKPNLGHNPVNSNRYSVFRVSKYQQIYTDIISDKKLYPKEISETTYKYKFLVHFSKARWSLG